MAANMHPKINGSQSGAATLLMSLVLVSLIGMISVYTAQVSVVEQKISNNHIHLHQTFETAETGLQVIINNLDNELLKIAKHRQHQTGYLQDFIDAGIPINTTIKDTQGKKLGYFTFQFSAEEMSNNVNITINAFSQDNTSKYPNQTLHQKVSYISLIAQQPYSSVIAKNQINLGNTETVISNFSPSMSIAIWAGGSIKNDSKLLTTFSNNTLESDQNISNLSNNDFFNNFFTETKNRIKAESDHVIQCPTGCNGDVLYNTFNMPLTGIIWVDTLNPTNNTYGTMKISENISLGSSKTPVVLIVDGKLEIDHSATTVTGMLYTTQSFNNNGAGNIIGTIISEQDITINGKMNIRYDEQVFKNLIDQRGRFTRVAGTWRDF